MSDEKRETVSDIVAQMRGCGEDGRMDMSLWRDYADRIEAAANREKAEIEADALAVCGIVEAARRREATTEKSSAVGNVAACKKRDEVVLRLSKEEYKGMQEALSEHDRLCEMLSESHKSVGNAAEMREALKTMNNLFEQGVICTSYANSAEEMEQIEELYRKAKSVLSAPPRNCDAGTAEEQAERMRLYCNSHGEDESGCFRCEECPFLTDERCELTWAQMPYEAQEGGAK